MEMKICNFIAALVAFFESNEKIYNYYGGFGYFGDFPIRVKI
jgi:hypothetical protein